VSAKIPGSSIVCLAESARLNFTPPRNQACPAFSDSRVATVALVAIVLMLPFVAQMPPWGEGINRFLPAYPALQLIERAPDIMPTWAAFTVLAGWAIVPPAIGVIAGGRSSNGS
jgi:hypothetical protein